MIIKELNALYIHIPKTGGTSIGNIFHPNNIIEDRKEGSLGFKYSDFLENPIMHVAEHLSYNEYKNKLISQNLNIQYFYTFTFVRNPYSRVYSTWKFLQYQKQQQNPIFNDIDQNVLISFNEFISFLANSDFYSWIIPQIYFITSNQCNFIGRYENFNNDLVFLLDKFGINSEIPHLNKLSLNINEYKNFMTRDIQNLIYKKYEPDFIEFKYSYFID